MSRLEISNPAALMRVIAAASKAAAADHHRGLIVLHARPDATLATLATTLNLPFVSSDHTSDRADRITEVLGSEFDLLVHETHELTLDAGLLAALAGTVKAGGVLLLGLPFSPSQTDSAPSPRPFNQRFNRLLADLQHRFPSKVHHLTLSARSAVFSGKSTTGIENLAGSLPTALVQIPPCSHTLSGGHPYSAILEQAKLLHQACRYLRKQPRGCITITGRRGRGKSALMGRIADWLDQQGISCAVTAARQPALTSVHRHHSGRIGFLASAIAHQSGCRVLLVDEASSLPIFMLERYVENHPHVIFCTTVEGYENAGRAFDIRFQDVLARHHAQVLSLQPVTPWRWQAGDPLEHLIDTLLLGGSQQSAPTSLESGENSRMCSSESSPAVATGLTRDLPIRIVDRAALALDEALLRQVFGLLRDTHYQTSATDLAHLLDAPDLQLWILGDQQSVKAALLLVVEGGIEPELHQAIIEKQRRLPHRLLPQLLAQSANSADALSLTYGRIIRIAVIDSARRQGLGSQLLRAMENALMSPAGPVSGTGASFASDAVSIAFWKKNGYQQFHTGYKPNPRTGKQAIAVIKSCTKALDCVLQMAVDIHEDNQRWLKNRPDRIHNQPRDAELLQRFANGQRSMYDTFAALSRFSRQQRTSLDQATGTSRRRYETQLREAVKAALR